MDKVIRWAEPPLAERAFIVEQALSVELRRSGRERTLAEVSASVIAHANVSTSSVAWDSRRREDGKWVVTAHVSGSHPLTATWLYDHAGRNLHPLDAGARRLSGVNDADAEPAAESVATPVPAVAGDAASDSRPHLVAVPSVPEPSAEPYEDHSVGADADAAPASPTQPTLAIPVEPTPVERKPKARPKGKRASIPSWDEILFGGPHHDAD